METRGNNDTSLICEIDHPFFNIIDNLTRRQILRLIACEHNYGNRIANILDLSTPAIHRHLKYLQGDNPGNIPIIGITRTTKTSHSGHKGGEANLLEIKSKIGLFFHIFPNYIHSHLLELDDDQPRLMNSTRDNSTLEDLEPFDNGLELDNLELSNIFAEIREIAEGNPENLSKIKEIIPDEKLRAAFFSIYNTIQRQNKAIRDLEDQLMGIMGIKNDFMEIVDVILKGQNDLSYEDRVILRAISCLGKQCSSDLSHLMNLDTYTIEKYVDVLKEKQWLKK